MPTKVKPVTVAEALSEDVKAVQQSFALRYASVDIPQPVTREDTYLYAILVELRMIRTLLKQKQANDSNV